MQNKNAIGASLPKDLYQEFVVRSNSFPGGKSALIRDALRSYFEVNKMSDHDKEQLQKLITQEEQQA